MPDHLTVPPLNPRAPLVLDTRDLPRRPGALRTVARTVPAPADLGLELISVPEGTEITLDLRMESVSEGVLVCGTVTGVVIWGNLHRDVLLAADCGELAAAVTPPAAEHLDHLADALLLRAGIPRGTGVDTGPGLRQSLIELLVGGAGMVRQPRQEARTLIEKAFKLAPEDPFIMDSLGWVYYRQGNMGEALRYLHLAYSTRSDPEIAAHLGEVLWKSGQHDEAQKVWRTALTENPNHETLLAVMQKYRP